MTATTNGTAGSTAAAAPAPEEKTAAIAKAMARAAEEAIQCQDACNGSGVLFSFARHMQTICDASATLGTEARGGRQWKNQHPVIFLFTYKLQALNGHEQLGLYRQYNWAESECKRIQTDVADDPATIPGYTPYAEVD